MPTLINELDYSEKRKLRSWLLRPNGAYTTNNVTFEAVEGGGILIRTRSKPERNSSMKETIYDLINNVRKWAEARNIIKGSTPIKQHDKLLEEVMELRDGIVRFNSDNEILHFIGDKPFDSDRAKPEIKDAIGDCTVCLLNLCTMYDLSFEECLQLAYDEIKDRKGRMINGTFVKEENLPENQ